MNREDAEAVIGELNGRIARREGWEATAFEIRRLWIDTEDGEAVIRIVYRQGGGAWAGFAKRDLFPWVYQDHMLTPQQVADDIYDFVLGIALYRSQDKAVTLPEVPGQTTMTERPSISSTT